MKKGIIADAFANIEPESEQYVGKNLDISQQIIAILKKKGWTQKVLAKKMNKRESEISKLLSGLHNLTLNTITNIEVVLGEDIILTPLKAEEKYKKTAYIKLKVEAVRNNKQNVSQINNATYNWNGNKQTGKLKAS